MDVKDLNIGIALNVSVFFLGFVAPGFLIFYLLSPSLFMALDFWKLFMLATSITVPTFVLHLMMALCIYFSLQEHFPNYVHKWGGPREWYIRVGFGNSINMYGVALLIWIFDFGVKGFVVCCTINIAISSLMEFRHFIRFARDPEGFNYGFLPSLPTFIR